MLNDSPGWRRFRLLRLGRSTSTVIAGSPGIIVQPRRPCLVNTRLISRWWMTGDTSSTNKCSAEWELCRTTYPAAALGHPATAAFAAVGARRRSLEAKGSYRRTHRCTLLSIVPRLEFLPVVKTRVTSFNSWVAGSSPAGPKGNRSSNGRATKAYFGCWFPGNHFSILGWVSHRPGI
jgi:hypothetical protein